MRFYSLLPTLAIAPVVFSLSVPSSLRGLLGDDDGSRKAHHFGAPSPPWKHGSKPGWYYSSNNDHHPDVFCLSPVLSSCLPFTTDHLMTAQPICKFLEAHNYGIRCPTGHPPKGPPPTGPPPSGPPPSGPPPTGPPPPVIYEGYLQTFQNLTGATQAGDYLTFGLVDTVDSTLQLYHNQR